MTESEQARLERLRTLRGTQPEQRAAAEADRERAKRIVALHKRLKGQSGA